MTDTTLKKAIRHQKKQIRLGPDACCASCQKADLLILQVATLVLCTECRLTLSSKSTTEKHHPTGQHNDSFSVPLPANAHAVLSDGQIDWPKATLLNPDGDFLRALAGWLRF